MKTFFSKLFPLTLVFVFVFSLCLVLVPIRSFADVDTYITFNFSATVSGDNLFIIFQDGVEIARTGNASISVHVTSSAYFSVRASINSQDYSTCSVNSYNVSTFGSSSTFSGSASSFSFNPVINLAFSSRFNSVRYFYFSLTGFPESTSTPTPEPTATPSPEPSATPSIFDAFQPFRSFSGTYYNREALYFPDSVTSNRYQQYSGIVSNHDAMITDIRINIDYYSDSVVYKFEYDLDYLTVGTSYDFSFLYDADQAFGYVSAYSTVDGRKYDVLTNQNTLSGAYTVCGCAPYPSSSGQLTPNLWEFHYNLSNQRAINLGSIIATDSKITLTVIFSADEFPYLPSGFDWSQFFQDTRPDNAFLYTLGGLAALPFFVSGLSFLALGALIGIILKFMR